MSDHNNNGPPTEAFWGKSSGRDAYHPLICHAVDTMLVAERLLPMVLGPHARDVLLEAFTPLGDPIPWAAALCGLHDIGKCSPTFQSLVFELSKDLLGEWALADLEMTRKNDVTMGRVDTPHGLVTALHFRDVLKQWGASVDTAVGIAAVLGGHHGHFPAGQDFEHASGQVNNHGGPRWAAWRTELFHELVRLRGLPAPDQLPWCDVVLPVQAAIGLAALTTVSDWIASGDGNFTSPMAGLDLEKYFVDAAGRADAAIERARLQPWAAPLDTGFSALFDDPEQRPVQEVVERLTVRLDGPSLVLVEAPTGEGKTKAALQAASAMVRQGRANGMYFALPTQATSNQTLGVVEDMLAGLGDLTPVNLAHSSARDFLVERVTSPTDVGRDEDGDHDLVARTWFTRKKNLLSALGVGTIDQALKGAIRSGHVFVRLAALSSKVVVIDEVHAYDLYMSTLLERLLMWLGACGASVIMLSATLPSDRRGRLIQAWRGGLLERPVGQLSPVPECAAYPRVSIATADDVVVESAEISKINANRTIRLERVSDEGVVDWLLGHALAGRCVAVVHNLVKRAISTRDALKARIDQLPEKDRPLLLEINGPMPAKKRREAEADLQRYFGKGGDRPPAIVVGTQVLEQSLDLDFDVMLSDLAPIDSLIQRAGRVHRHDRDPDRGPQVLGVTGVEFTPTGPRFPPSLHTVYAPIVLLRTCAVLDGETTIQSPIQVPVLIDRVYQDEVECPAGWEQAWAKAATQLAKARDSDMKAAARLYLPMPFAVDGLSNITERPKNPGLTRRQRGNRS
ncbi:CRISPR-associated helicase Cas3' [Umezawaea sp. NPDC059074]|uniref:CRISPR-associated helicase Cas3' n=1 Tax=Umezawaea sp. NPDC059074 TaxID=3346716 RepID=UPI00369003A9